MKRVYSYLPFAILLFCTPLARAQGSFDVAMGFGTARAKANAFGIDTTNFGSCVVTPTSTTCEATPALGRLFMGFQGDAMVNKHLGFGAGLNFQPTKGNYGPLLYRQLFYDFDGLYTPVNNKKVQLRLEGGIGGGHSAFSYQQTACIGTAVCTTQSASVGSSNHLQVHVGAGVQIYVKDHFFVRPEFDFREVPGFANHQFGTNQVYGFTVWAGYNFGEM